MNTNEEKDFKILAKSDFTLQREISGNIISVPIEKGEVLFCWIGIDGLKIYAKVMKDGICIADFGYKEAAEELFEFVDYEGATEHQKLINGIYIKRHPISSTRMPEWPHKKPKSFWEQVKMIFE